MKYRIALALALALSPSLAWAQGAILQSGPSTQFDVLGFIGDHHGEAGSKIFSDNARGFNPIHIYDKNLIGGVCVDDALTTGPYHEACLTPNSLTFTGFNGAATQGFNIVVNGSPIPIPGSIQGMPSVANNAGLTALASTFSSGVLRLGVTAPGALGEPAVIYHPSTGACSLNGGAGDGGSQVPTSDGKCWIAQFNAAVDAREFTAGGSQINYPFVMHVSATGSDQGGLNYCLDVNHPCASLQQAYNAAAKMDFQHQNNTIFLDGTAGTPFSGPGFVCSGSFIGSNTANPDSLLNINSNNYLYNTISNIPGTVASVIPSNFCAVAFSNVTIASGSGQYGLFVQNSAYVNIGNNVRYTGVASVTAEYAEALANIEHGQNQNLIIQGSYTVALQANNAYVQMDPSGSTGNFSAGTGLTVNQFIEADNGGTVLWFEPTANVGTTTGDLVRASANSKISVPVSSVSIPGNGAERLWGGANLTDGSGNVLHTPIVGACTNGGVINSGSNYAFQIQFAGGANSTCTVNFGKAGNAATFFSAAPICTTHYLGGGAVSPVPVISNLTNTLVTLIPSAGTFVNGSAIMVLCTPQNGG